MRSSWRWRASITTAHCARARVAPPDYFSVTMPFTGLTPTRVDRGASVDAAAGRAVRCRL
jgi:hypothetical protein